MNIGWPEGIWIALVSLQLIIHLSNDGKEMPENTRRYNFGSRLAGVLISGIILYWGGFFS